MCIVATVTIVYSCARTHTHSHRAHNFQFQQYWIEKRAIKCLLLLLCFRRLFVSRKTQTHITPIYDRSPELIAHYYVLDNIKNVEVYAKSIINKVIVHVTLTFRHYVNAAKACASRVHQCAHAIFFRALSTSSLQWYKFVVYGNFYPK